MLNLNRRNEPAEEDDIPDDIRRDMVGWVRNWPRTVQAYEMFQGTGKEYLVATLNLNNAIARKLNSRGLSPKEEAALKNLLNRTAAVKVALDKLI